MLRVILVVYREPLHAAAANLLLLQLLESLHLLQLLQIVIHLGMLLLLLELEEGLDLLRAAGGGIVQGGRVRWLLDATHSQTLRRLLIQRAHVPTRHLVAAIGLSTGELL